MRISVSRPSSQGELFACCATTLLTVTSHAHYFSPTPGKDLERCELRVHLAGAERSLVSAKGLFSFDGLDKATAVLLAHTDLFAPIAPGSEILDVGCGWGPIALSLALLQPDCHVTAIDVNPHARTITRENAKRLGLTNVTVAAPEEVPESARFDALWSNPPIRIGKSELHALLTRWIGQLHSSGSAAMVVGKNLGADSLATWMEKQFPARHVEKVHSSKGFRLLGVGPECSES